jgi:uncharacterized membrane protein YcjF (UPF0283 family)
MSLSASDKDNARPPQRRRRQWQFGLAALLGTMMLLCLPFALWGAVLRANQADQFWLMLMCAAAPLGVLTLTAVTVSVGRIVRNWRRKSAGTPSDYEM